MKTPITRRRFIEAGGSLASLAFLSGGQRALAAAPGDPEATGPGGGANPNAAAKLAPRFGDGRDWWFEKRFGMFIHWGIYSINGWHEQDQWRRRIPRAEYTKLAQRWNPVKFNPNAWLDLAQEAGMQYLCVTTKHHDGFCLFESKHTDYNSVNTPYGKDVIKLLAEACHRRNFPLCLYYSIADWHHPNYPNQDRHHELPPQAGDQPDLDKYTDFVRAQVRELCTNYGEIHGIWWDINVDKRVDRSMSAMIRQLQPKAMINDRGYDEGDFGTPERDFTSDGELLVSFEKRTEACQAVGSESWGYRAEEDFYTDRHLMRSIDKYLARDANYLLNVGPAPDGTIPKPGGSHPQTHRQMVPRGERVLCGCGSVFAAHHQPRRASDPQREHALCASLEGSHHGRGQAEAPGPDAEKSHPAEQRPAGGVFAGDGSQRAQGAKRLVAVAEAAGQRVGQYGAGGQVGV